ncbi:MAG: glycosyltransferase family 39 protein [Elusimicrobiota bacterium]
MKEILPLLRSNRAGVLVFLAPLAAAAWYLRDRPGGELFVNRYAFYFMAFIFAAWALALAGALKKVFAEGSPLREYGAGLLFSLAVAASVFISVKPEFRVLADEANLLGVSRSMVYDRRADIVTMSKNYYHNAHPVARESEKRPHMYPFFTSLVHAVSGYRPANAFAVNFILLAALLGCVFVLFRGLYGPLPAYAAVLLTASQPLLALTASSGGMEFMSAAFMFFSFLALRRFLREPSAETFALFWFTLAVMANVRYEGPAVMAAVALALLVSGRLKREQFASWPFLLTPLMLLPAFCQRFCMAANFENPPGVTPFSIVSAFEHSWQFIKAQAAFSPALPYSSVSGVLGLLAILLYVPKLFMREEGGSSFRAPLYGSAAFSLLVYMSITAAFHFSDPSSQAAARYYAPAALVLALLSAALLGRIAARKPAAAPALIALSAALFITHIPPAAENRYMNLLILTRQHKHEAAFLERLGERNVLVVSDRPRLFTVRGYGAVNFWYARDNAGELLSDLERKLYPGMIVMQEVLYSTGKPTPETDPGPAYSLTPLYEVQNTADSYIRVAEARPASGKAKR